MTTNTTAKKRDADEAAIAVSERDDNALPEREISEFGAAGRSLDTNGINLLRKKYGGKGVRQKWNTA